MAAVAGVGRRLCGVEAVQGGQRGDLIYCVASLLSRGRALKFKHVAIPQPARHLPPRRRETAAPSLFHGGARVGGRRNSRLYYYTWKSGRKVTR